MNTDPETTLYLNGQNMKQCLVQTSVFIVSEVKTLANECRSIPYFEMISSQCAEADFKKERKTREIR